MASKNKIWLIVMLAVVAISVITFFVACDKNPDLINITGVTFEDVTVNYDGNEHEITVTGKLPEGVSVQYHSNKATAAGEYTATAIITGKGYSALILDAKLTIKALSITGVTFEDVTVNYDGNEHEISVAGQLPEGVRIEYRSNRATAVGEYTATATLTGEGYDTTILTAKLTILSSGISGVTFEDVTVNYDGNVHEITVTGELPYGVSVQYRSNKAIDVGEYTATAILWGEGYDTTILTAKLTITNSDISGVTFEDATVNYDGSEHEITVTGQLPDGVSVEYRSNKAIDVGEYTATATLKGEGYNTLTLTAKLTIKALIITDVSFKDLTVDFDGNEHVITIDGTLPQGVSVSYTSNTATAAGEYVATAILSGTGYETLTLTANLKINDVPYTLVSNAEQLTTALSKGGLILFGDDIVLDNGNIARITTDTYLNGRGYTLTAVNYGTNYAVINVTDLDNSTVTISNLNIVADKWVQWLRGINVQANNNLTLNINNVDVNICDYYALNILDSCVNLVVNMTDSKLSAWAAVYNRASGATFNAKNCILDGTNTHASPNTTDNYFSMFIVSEYVLLNDDEFILKNLSANNRFTLTDCELIARIAVDSNGEPIDTMQKLFDIRSPYNNQLELIDCTFKPAKYEKLVYSAYDSYYIPKEHRDDPDFVADTNKVIINGVDVTKIDDLVENYYDE